MSRTPHLAVAALAALAAVLAGPAGADSGDVAFDSGLQWNLDRIGVEAAWEVGRGQGTTIAVIDSGVALHHEDLTAKLVDGVACRDTGGDPDACTGSPTDDDGHGTHVAGVAAATTGNGSGIAGTAPDARLMPIKVLFHGCETCESAGNADDVAAAVRWAAQHGADVINLSLGSTTATVFGAGFVEAVEFAWSQGSIPVVAAGNEYVLTADLGAATAVVVSATDRADGAPPYSNGVGNASWALAAPGGDGSDTAASCSPEGQPRGILSTYWADDDPTSAYACLSGTSMAAPHVSGALAVLRSIGFEPEAAVRQLLDTAVDIGEPGHDPVFGAGRLDLAAAVTEPVDGAGPEAPEPDDVAPTATPTSSPPTLPELDPEPEASSPQLFAEGDDDEVPGALLAAAIALVLAGWTAAGLALARLRR